MNFKFPFDMPFYKINRNGERAAMTGMILQGQRTRTQSGERKAMPKIRVFLQKARILLAVKKFLAFYETLSFIKCSQEPAAELYVCPDQHPAHKITPITYKSILILSSHLSRCLEIGSFSEVFELKFCVEIHLCLVCHMSRRPQSH
jgi:hypothetical protein